MVLVHYTGRLFFISFSFLILSALNEGLQIFLVDVFGPTIYHQVLAVGLLTIYPSRCIKPVLYP